MHATCASLTWATQAPKLQKMQSRTWHFYRPYIQVVLHTDYKEIKPVGCVPVCTDLHEATPCSSVGLHSCSSWQENPGHRGVPAGASPPAPLLVAGLFLTLSPHHPAAFCPSLNMLFRQRVLQPHSTQHCDEYLQEGMRHKLVFAPRTSTWLKKYWL